ncbi:MAG: hypothetical protein H0X24_19970 [Ktedonobacterales bacterium]|nr:hypothetical protein [Ktedonobacterales bacterium]
MATTASRVAKGRPTTNKPGMVRSTPQPKGKSAPGTKGQAVAPPKSPSPLAPVTAPRALTADGRRTPADPPAPSRMSKMLASVQSVQAASDESKPWPRWRKIALWAVMLMPIYAILIYLIGGAYFVHAGMNGVGLNKSLPPKVLAVVNGVSIPDQEGVFMQTGADPTQPLNLVMPYNDRALKPPLDQQFTVSASQLRYLLIRQAQVSLPTDYQVFQIDNKDVDHLVKNVVARRVSVPRIALVSLALPAGQTWAPGSYVIVSPDLDDGTYYYFFTVTK